MSDDPLAFIKDALAGVEREAKKSVGDRIYVTWSEHYNNWIDFFQPLLKGLSARNSRDDSDIDRRRDRVLEGSSKQGRAIDNS